jgi:hypothetical protein
MMRMLGIELVGAGLRCRPGGPTSAKESRANIISMANPRRNVTMTQLLDAKRARVVAGIGGVLYLVIIVIGALGEGVVRGSVVVAGNATATAANLRSMEGLWRLGVAGEIVLLSCATAVALILYVLLRPVSRDLALGAVFFNLVSIAVEGVAAVFLAAALLPITGASYVDAFTQEQLGVMAMQSVRFHSLGFGIALVFFGIECVIVGYLISRSGYMPKIIGVLMQIAGVCYLINSFALLLSPRLSSLLFPTILMPSLIGELSLALWLLVKGVRAEKWDPHVGAGLAGA